jgi:hypothetical protein
MPRRLGIVCSIRASFVSLFDSEGVTEEKKTLRKPKNWTKGNTGLEKLQTEDYEIKKCESGKNK